MDLSSPSERHKLPPPLPPPTGDVDRFGDAIDPVAVALAPAVDGRRARLEAAVGPFVAADVDRAEHLAAVERLLGARCGTW